jgi:hypothetical protein
MPGAQRISRALSNRISSALLLASSVTPMAQSKWNFFSEQPRDFFGPVFAEIKMQKPGMVPKILENVFVVGILPPPQIDYCATLVADTQCYPIFHGSVVRIDDIAAPSCSEDYHRR